MQLAPVPGPSKREVVQTARRNAHLAGLVPATRTVARAVHAAQTLTAPGIASSGPSGIPRSRREPTKLPTVNRAGIVCAQLHPAAMTCLVSAL
jgi:hypothetical protein